MMEYLNLWNGIENARYFQKHLISIQKNFSSWVMEFLNLWNGTENARYFQELLLYRKESFYLDDGISEPLEWNRVVVVLVFSSIQIAGFLYRVHAVATVK